MDPPRRAFIEHFSVRLHTDFSAIAGSETWHQPTARPGRLSRRIRGRSGIGRRRDDRLRAASHTESIHFPVINEAFGFDDVIALPEYRANAFFRIAFDRVKIF